MPTELSEFEKAVEMALEKAKNTTPTEQRMHVYFDEPGNIKCITPVPDETYHDSYLHTTLPVAEVYKFITGELATNKYKVQKKKGTVNEYVIVKRVSEYNFVRSLSRFLTEVELGYDAKHEIEIVVDSKKSSITFRITEPVRDKIYETIDDNNTATINSYRILNF